MDTIHLVSIAALAPGGLSAAADILRGRRQRMAVMKVVWPNTGLYLGPLSLVHPNPTPTSAYRLETQALR